ncbi:ATP synthase F0 subunit A [Candidatus Wirthbacteria bacterium CG2_30_54_11]|uniref:ATP synthase subunit a n=1 Tax=Candidatus Wirthbacteria bacterium CG2_30_54_11 TaxID=1817892 RepID=A0A1J5IN54_9BACT|nr:MAG: ATP synthase F0 subunit A [Candidatus Wirthbacteria bacterium CG2_30_54_11]
MELIWDKAAHVSIKAEELFEILNYPVTNSLLTTFIVSLIIIGLGILVRKGLKIVPSRLQAVFETLVESLYNLVKSTVPATHVDEFYPLIMTFFIFILMSNWLGLLPGMSGFGLAEPAHEAAVEGEAPEEHADAGSDAIAYAVTDETLTENVTLVDVEAEPMLTSHEEAAETAGEETTAPKFKIVPLLRGATADLNTTIALALIAVASTWYYGIKHLGLKGHLGKFFNLKGIGSFVGILEFIGEFSRIISFSFRLFGNIFAGEVLLAIIGSLIPVFVPIPFLGLEVFVGFIQALVFAMLTMVFLGMAVEKGH